ncbi:MAG: hypothetical protein HC939_10160 [Pleurocapsa sp. SU_5_0]|nr:hypothetical protein [Pleurocapsa sp. SU_5_0]NJR48015.1 hypothetical protein [Hyellaceae cyanobacterium CSU_1_1]
MQDKIDKANTKLDKIKIMQRGNRLTLRGTLPPKPNNGIKPTVGFSVGSFPPKTRRKQYTISPGLPATRGAVDLAMPK